MVESSGKWPVQICLKISLVPLKTCLVTSRKRRKTKKTQLITLSIASRKSLRTTNQSARNAWYDFGFYWLFFCTCTWPEKESSNFGSFWLNMSGNPGFPFTAGVEGSCGERGLLARPMREMLVVIPGKLDSTSFYSSVTRLTIFLYLFRVPKNAAVFAARPQFQRICAESFCD